MALNANQQSVVDLFIAAYGRAPTQTGLDFFTGKLDSGDMSLKDISNYMFDTRNNPEAATRYPDSGTLDDKVNAVFNHVLGRSVATQSGMDFWKSKFDNPDYTMKDLVFDVLQEAKNNSDDNHTLENKSAVVEYFLTHVPADQQAGNQISTDTVTDDASVTSADAAIDAIAAASGGSDAVNLTSDPDTVTANVINAGRVWNPNGSDQMNSLNDDDNLTGTGDNPTLNVTVVNDTESGDLNIMPKLNGIETVNVAFTADNDQTIDLQDASGIVNLNATRIDNINPVGNAQIVTFDNIQSVLTTASVTNSNDNTAVDIAFDHSASVLSGTTDEVALSLSNVQMDDLRIDGGTEGYESINLASTGGTNTLNTLTAESLQTLIITGDTSLRLGGTANTMSGTLDEGDTYLAGLNNVAGSLKKVDASALTASLTYHIGAEINASEDGTGANIELEVIGSASDDTFVLTNGSNIDAVAGNTDKINGGEGNDTLIITGGNIAAPTSGANLTSLENLEIRTGQDALAVADVVTVDADAFDALESIYVRNEGQVAAVAPTVAPNTTSRAEAMTVNLDDLSADLANSGKITIASGTTGNSGMANNVLNLNLKDASGSADAATVNIATGVNTTATDSRFNFELSVDGDNASRTPSEDAGAVESLTINDNDSESNTVRLVNVAEEIGTITLTGGTAGTFMNLDDTTAAGAASNGGLYQYDTTGNNTPTATAGAQPVTADGQQIADRSAAAQAHIVADTFDASAYTGDVVARFSTAQDANGVATSTGAQTITTGSGNDTIIFDNLADNRAGLTISDKVNAGEGNDTIVIDGNIAGGTIALSASEWTNVTNFENIRLVNAGAGSSYAITVTDDMITNNHGTDGLLNIINDNDSLNDTAGNIDGAGVQAESAVVIDASTLSSAKHFSYNGEEGATQTADRIIVSDANMNGQNIIDGGALDNLSTTNGNVVDVVNAVTAGVGNGDVLEIRNAAVVTVGDLENVKNIGTLEFTTDKSTTQVSRLQLNDETVDTLVDSYHTSLSRGGANATTAGSPERLQVNALDSTAISSVATATTGLTLEAATLTDKSDLDILLGRGANNVTTGAGNDQVVLLGNYVAGTYAVNENGVALNDYSTAGGAARVVTDTINLGTGTDTLTTYGAINLVGANLAGIENMVAHSAVVMTAEQFNALSSLTFEGDNPHQLHITAGNGAAVNLANVHLAGGSLVYDTSAVTGGVTGAVDVQAGASGGASAGTVGENPTNPGGATTLTAGGTFIGTDGVDDNFKGTIASLAGTTITGNDADTETLTITDAGTVNLSTNGSTITNIDKLILANGTNNITLASTEGITEILGGTGTDSITLGNNANTLDLLGVETVVTGTAVDILTTSGNVAITGDATVNDTYNVLSGTATITTFGGSDVLNVSAGATAVVTVASNYTATAATQSVGTGTATLTASANEVINLSSATVATTATDGFNISSGGTGDITGSAGADTITSTGGAKNITGGAGDDTITLSVAGNAEVVIFSAAATNGVDTIATFTTTEDDLNFAATATILNSGTPALVKVTADNTAGSANDNILMIDDDLHTYDTVAALNADTALDTGTATFGSGIAGADATVVLGWEDTAGNTHLGIATIADAGGISGDVVEIATLTGIDWEGVAAADFVLA